MQCWKQEFNIERSPTHSDQTMRYKYRLEPIQWKQLKHRKWRHTTPHLSTQPAGICHTYPLSQYATHCRSFLNMHLREENKKNFVFVFPIVFTGLTDSWHSIPTQENRQAFSQYTHTQKVILFTKKPLLWCVRDHLPAHLLHGWRAAGQNRTNNNKLGGRGKRWEKWVWLTILLVGLLVGGLFFVFGLSLTADVSKGVVLGTGKSAAGKHKCKLNVLRNSLNYARA